MRAHCCQRPTCPSNLSSLGCDLGAAALTRERAVGTFARQLTLGRGLATDQISADYSDGVLTLTIPVAEAAKPRKIAVQHSTRDVPGEITEGAATEEQPA